MDQNAFTFSTWWAQGGAVMYPLALYSIVAVGILIEKLFFLKKLGRDGVDLARSCAENALKGETTPPEGATPVHIIINRVFKLSGKGLSTEALIRAGEREVARLEDIAMRGMIILAIIGNTSPFIGLFGTVVGIIRAFHGLSTTGLMADITSNTELIRGISEALVATATGLLVAVPAVIFYNILLREIKSRMTKIELAVSDYADALGNFRENGS